jgi:NAD(P)-dependent dehydrogenase (short-subunit alcohol dehydrogenase family)
MLLKDHVAMVTGAGQGIGKAIALALAREGADIAVLDIDRETAEATAREIRDTGRRVAVNVADVSEVEAVRTAVHEFAREFGRLDVLVNNAGIEARGAFLDITPSDWQRQLDVTRSVGPSRNAEIDGA